MLTTYNILIPQHQLLILSMAHIFTDTVSDSTTNELMSTGLILHYSIHKIKNKVHNLD